MTNLSIKSLINKILIIIFGLILPFLLIIVVRFTGYSEIIEEIAKAIIVLTLIIAIPKFSRKILFAILFGFLFGLSENMFYLRNIFELGDFDIFTKRFIWTLPMHIITVLILALSASAKKWLILFGLILAIILHILFNNLSIDFLNSL